ncbi:MAG: DUF998 domain-containing protein [Patescibacteria group bacterium]|jgi:hypothetical membrane protein
MNCKSLYIGIISPILYIVAVVVGGFLRPGYSHYHNTINELTVAGSEPLVIIIVLFFLYNIGLILIGIGPGKAVHTKLVKTTLRIVGLMGLFGGLMYFFPQDPRNAEATTAGTIHIVMAGVLSLLTITAAVIAGFGLRLAQQKKLASVSWGLATGILITGGLTALAVAQGWQYVGLWERFTIGMFLAWLVWFTLNVKRILYHEFI